MIESDKVKHGVILYSMMQYGNVICVMLYSTVV
jgi:hypothetical protein